MRKHSKMALHVSELPRVQMPDAESFRRSVAGGAERAVAAKELKAVRFRSDRRRRNNKRKRSCARFGHSNSPFPLPALASILRHPAWPEYGPFAKKPENLL